MNRNLKIGIALTLATGFVTGCSSTSSNAGESNENNMEVSISDNVKIDTPVQFAGFEKLPKGWEYTVEGSSNKISNAAKTCFVTGTVQMVPFSPMGLGDTFLTNHTFQSQIADTLEIDDLVLGNLEVKNFLGKPAEFMTYNFTAERDEYHIGKKSGVIERTADVPTKNMIALRAFSASLGNEEDESKQSTFAMIDATCNDLNEFERDTMESIASGAIISYPEEESK